MCFCSSEGDYDLGVDEKQKEGFRQLEKSGYLKQVREFPGPDKFVYQDNIT